MSKQILLLDDDIEGRDVVELILKRKKYDVIAVSNAEQAHQLLEELHFDLIIIDGLLPDTNGVDFISKARHDGYQNAAFLLSGHSFFWQDTQTVHMLTHNLNASILSKPLYANDLLDNVYKAIGPAE